MLLDQASQSGNKSSCCSERQGYRDTGMMQGCRDSGKQGFRDGWLRVSKAELLKDVYERSGSKKQILEIRHGASLRVIHRASSCISLLCLSVSPSFPTPFHHINICVLCFVKGKQDAFLLLPSSQAPERQGPVQVAVSCHSPEPFCIF